jgi:hypothetical protein
MVQYGICFNGSYSSWFNGFMIQCGNQSKHKHQQSLLVTVAIWTEDMELSNKSLN